MQRRPHSAAREYAGTVITPANRLEFELRQVEAYKEQYYRVTPEETQKNPNEVEQVAKAYARFQANREVKHFNTFLKGKTSYKFHGMPYPVLTRASIKEAKTADQIIEINKVDQ